MIQNELVLVGVLDSIFDTISTLLKGQVDKRTMFDNLELILLTIDEALDHGHIMELDPLAIVSRVLMKASEATAVSINYRVMLTHGSITYAPNVFIIDEQQAQTIGDLSIAQALALARDQFMKTISTGTSSSTGGGDGY